MTTTPENSCRVTSFSYPDIVTSKKTSSQFLIKKIYKLFNKKYSKLPLTYDSNIIDNIIYNEKSHIVAEFKDRLIVDDTGEFLKRYYRLDESEIRLPKFYEYYELYSKIFPNYTAFYEGKYLYQNIQRKQRMIDLQEKMELEERKNKEKIYESSSYSDSKENNVFNTDAIDSILNGTNNEGIEIIFDVNKNNLNKDEDEFCNEIKKLIGEIDNYEIKKKKIEGNNKINKNKFMKNNNFNHNFSNNNINSSKNISHKENLLNKNVSVPINLNYKNNNNNNKKMPISNSSLTINNPNITYYSNIQSIISKFFNVPSYQKRNILNINSKSKQTAKVNSKKKNVSKKDKILVEKLEKNLFKMHQKSVFFQKNLSQNISTSHQTQKDISTSKKNSSIYTKKPSTSKSSNHNPKQMKKNINSIYKIQNNNILHNLDIAKKGASPLTSRNSKPNKIGTNLDKLKNMKDNTHYLAEGISRNKYTNNINFQNKAKSTLKPNVYNRSINKIEENQNNKSNRKKMVNNSNTKYNEVLKSKKEIGYKEINYIKNKNSRNRKEIKQKILNSGNNNIINSRNFNIPLKNKNSMTKTKTVNKKKNNQNTSINKIGILDIMNIKKNFVKGFNINNFSKIINSSNVVSKNTFAKTYRNNFSIINK